LEFEALSTEFKNIVEKALEIFSEAEESSVTCLSDSEFDAI
jgi:hypothetical protein